MIELIKQPWPWYIAGPMIGLVVPLLLLLGNKSFGISSSLRHICASCIPADIEFFKYDWKSHSWNLIFVTGVIIGGILTLFFLSDPNTIVLDSDMKTILESRGITNFSGLIPTDIFNWEALTSLKGVLFMIVGGFLVGFGTRYAGGCTSGHAIMGLSNLQWPSLIATICFMVGGFISAQFIVPFLLSL